MWHWKHIYCKWRHPLQQGIIFKKYNVILHLFKYFNYTSVSNKLHLYILFNKTVDRTYRAEHIEHKSNCPPTLHFKEDFNELQVIFLLFKFHSYVYSTVK